MSVPRTTYLGQESKSQMGRGWRWQSLWSGRQLVSCLPPCSASPGRRMPAALPKSARSCTGTPPPCITLTGITVAKWSPPASATSFRTTVCTSAHPIWGPGSRRYWCLPHLTPAGCRPTQSRLFLSTSQADWSPPSPPLPPGEPELAQRTVPERAPVQRGLSELVGRLPHLLHLQDQLAKGLELDLR